MSLFYIPQYAVLEMLPEPMTKKTKQNMITHCPGLHDSFIIATNPSGKILMSL